MVQKGVGRAAGTFPKVRMSDLAMWWLKCCLCGSIHSVCHFMDDSTQKMFIRLESVGEYRYVVVAIISCPTGERHTHKITAMLKFLHFEPVAFGHAADV